MFDETNEIEGRPDPRRTFRHRSISRISRLKHGPFRGNLKFGLLYRFLAILWSLDVIVFLPRLDILTCFTTTDETTNNNEGKVEKFGGFEEFSREIKSEPRFTSEYSRATINNSTRVSLSSEWSSLFCSIVPFHRKRNYIREFVLPSKKTRPTSFSLSI